MLIRLHVVIDTEDTGDVYKRQIHSFAFYYVRGYAHCAIVQFYQFRR